MSQTATKPYPFLFFYLFAAIRLFAVLAPMGYELTPLNSGVPAQLRTRMAVRSVNRAVELYKDGRECAALTELLSSVERSEPYCGHRRLSLAEGRLLLKRLSA